MEDLGRRDLGTADAIGQTLAIAPIASVAFASYLVASYGGGATPLVILLAFVGALALGWVFAQFGRRYAGAGTVYEYLALGGTKALAVVAAGAYFIVNLIGAAGALVVGLVAQEFCKAHLGFDPGWWTFGLVALALVTILIYRDVRLSTRALLVLTGLASIPLLILAADILFSGGATGHTLSVFDPGNGDVAQALLYAVLLFLGFEAAACLGEETGRPHRSIPRAMIAGIALSGVFYLVMFYLLTIAFGPADAATTWGADPFAVIGLGDVLVGKPLSALIQLGLIVDLIALMIAVGNVVSRGVFTMARDRLLPRVFARTSRYGTPSVGIAMFALASLAVMAAAIFTPDNRFEPFEAVISATPIVTLIVYLAICVIGFRLLPLSLPLRVVALIVAAAVPVLGLYGSFDPFPEGPRLVGLFLALGSLALGAIWAAWLASARPELLSAAAGNARLAEPAPAPGPAS